MVDIFSLIPDEMLDITISFTGFIKAHISVRNTVEDSKESVEDSKETVEDSEK